MRTVYKYELEYRFNEQKIELPKGAKFLKFHVINERGFFWALVYTTIATEVRTFRLFAAGEEIPEDMMDVWEWRATLNFESGMVYHLFEKNEL